MWKWSLLFFLAPSVLANGAIQPLCVVCTATESQTWHCFTHITHVMPAPVRKMGGFLRNHSPALLPSKRWILSVWQIYSLISRPLNWGRFISVVASCGTLQILWGGIVRDLTTDIHNCPLFPAPIPRGERGPTLTFLPVSPLLHFDCAVFHQPLQVLIRIPQRYVGDG